MPSFGIPAGPPAHGVSAAGNGRANPLVVLSAAMLGLCVFMPHLVRFVLAPRVVVIVAAIIGLIAISLAKPLDRLQAVAVIAFLIPWLGVMTFATQIVRLGGHNEFQYERLLIEFPATASLGYIAHWRGRDRAYLRTFVIVGAVTAVLSVLEYTVGHSLVGREAALQSYTRGLGTRSLVFADQPLVMGATLAATIPLLGKTTLRPRILLAVILAAGSWCTGSRGPTIIAVIAVLLYLFRAEVRTLGARLSSAAFSLIAPALLASTIWLSVYAVDQVPGTSGDTYSANYRGALYALLPRILSARLFGYGVSGLPHGVWLAQSQLFGVVDLGQTVDSELILEAANFGILGVALYLLLGYASIRSLRRDPYIGLAAIAVWLSGLFLALHAWDSISPFWYFLIGSTLAAQVGRAGPSEPNATDPRHSRVDSDASPR